MPLGSSTFSDQRLTATLLSMLFLYGSSAGPQKCSGCVAHALAHPVLVGLSDYAFAVYLWATPVACAMRIYFTHGDPLAVTPGIVPDSANVTYPDVSPDSFTMSYLLRTNTPAFLAWIIVVHVWAVAYTDLFEASIFGSEAGCIGACMKRLRGRGAEPGKKQ